MGRVCVAVCLTASTLIVGAPPAHAGTLTLASTKADGTKGNRASEYPSLSWDGSKVAFSSSATNLDVGDTDLKQDIYVKDVTTGALTLASMKADGTKSDGHSADPSLSADGTGVAFVSVATNLADGDADSTWDVYVKDLDSGALTLASTSSTATKGNGDSFAPSLSEDGTRVAFYSSATNLDPGDADSAPDVYVKDLTTGALTLASTTSAPIKGNGPSFAPSLSADGTQVAFVSQATNLVPADTDATQDVYVKDLGTGALTLASTSSTGVKANQGSSDPSMSEDGTRVAFGSFATNLDGGDSDTDHDIYVKDLGTGALTLASTSSAGEASDGQSFSPSLSADGTIVAFEPDATNLDPADADDVLDVYVKDLTTGALTLASTATGGTKGTDDSRVPSLSGDGTTVAFHSVATNLDPGDADSIQDVYVNDLGVNSPPAVDAGPDVGGTTGSALTLNATVTDPDGDTVSTTWTVAPGDPCTFGDSAAIDTTITCTSRGRFTATLTADDGVNSPVTDTTQVTVRTGGGRPPPPAPPPPPPPSPTPSEPGVIEFSSATYPVMEGQRTARVELARSDGSDGPVSVEIATAEGSATDGNTDTATPKPRRRRSGPDLLDPPPAIPPDYSAVSGTIVFSEGETSKTVLVPIVDDPRVEGVETLQIAVMDPTGGAVLGTQQSATIEIADNDPNVSFRKARSTVDEDDCRPIERGRASWCEFDVSVLLSTPVPDVVTVNYAIVGGTATPDSDYQLGPGTVTFRSESRTLRASVERFTFLIRRDDRKEEEESIRVELSSPSNAALGPIRLHTITIAPSDPQGDVAGDSPATAHPVDLETRPRQIIDESLSSRGGDRADVFKVHLETGDELAIDVDSAGIGARLESSTLTILDGDGVRVLAVVGPSAEPDSGRTTSHPAHLFTAPAEGDYYLSLTPGLRESGNYSLELHRLALAAGTQDPAKLDVDGPMFVWLRGSSLAITGPTGYGFTLQGPWTATTTASSRGLTRSTVYRLPQGSDVTVASALGELQMGVASDIVVSTRANRWGHRFGQVNRPSIEARVTFPLGEYSNEFADVFGLLFERQSGLELDQWTIKLGSEILASGVGRDREIKEVLKGIPYLFSHDQQPQGGPIFKVKFGPIDTTTPESGTILIVDPTDPFFYINYISGPVHGVIANSSGGFVPFYPALPPTDPDIVGLEKFHGHSFAIAEAPIFAIFPNAKVGSFQAGANLSLGATRNVDLDANDDNVFLGGRGTAHELLSGDLSGFEDVYQDVHVGVDGQVKFQLQKNPFNFDVSLGKASFIYNGPEGLVWFRARKGAENPLAGTPFSFLGMSPQDEFEGVFSNDGRFSVTGSTSLDLPGDSGLITKLRIDNSGIEAGFEGQIKFSGSAGIDGVEASCRTTAGAAGDVAFSMPGGNLRMSGSLRVDGSIKCYVGGEKVGSASFDVSGRIDDGNFTFRLPYIGEESVSLF